jgi:hypothetical protein
MPENNDTKRAVAPKEKWPTCPLCGGRMRPRGRDPLLRAAGMLLVYLALLLLLLWLPGISVDEALAAALCLLTGAILFRQRTRPWCSVCGHVAET